MHDPYKVFTFVALLWLHLWSAFPIMVSSSDADFTDATASSGSSKPLGVRIERAPESAVAPKGDEVVFECELNLAPDRLQWRFKHSTAAGSGNNYRYLPAEQGYNITTEERVSKLRIYVTPETLGDYQCVAWYGPIAIASTSARLTLVSISIDNSNGYSRAAKRWSVAPKNCLLIRCGTVTSNPPAVWSFYRNGEKVPQSEVLPGGALILNSVSAKDSGNYTCSAMNAITGVEVQLPQSIDVRVDYTDRTPPYFLVQQPATEVAARPGETIVLECPGVGSPKPEAVWSSPNIVNIYNNRTKILPYGLQIVDVRSEDQGSYVCRLDNGIAPVLVHIMKLNVLERPRIIRGPAGTLTNEGERLELECLAAGNPPPEISWLINGEDTAGDNETIHEKRQLVIRHVQKRHAGIVQCFAKNNVGEISAGSLLEVNPKQIQGDTVLNMPLGHVPIRSGYDHSGSGGSSGGNSNGSGSRNKGKRKHMRVANMVPPSRPNVTRLSDDSVMLRWNVPKNDGLAIQFFKVQYRMLGDNARKIPRENWQTTNEDIPYGKRDRSYDGDKNFTSSATGLRPDRYYRFRIMAVYSNNDNKEGSTSVKFFLQRGAALGLAKSNLPVPELREIEAYSETAVMLHWTLPEQQQQQQQQFGPSDIDGFYAYYRPTSSAGEYLKATVDGMHTHKFKIDMLEPGTAYEFKLQSFNAHAASEFSQIKQGRTKKPLTTHAPSAPAVVHTTQANQEDNSIYPVVAGAAGGGLLLLIATIVACLCVKRRKHTQPEDEDKPQLDHIEDHFVTSAVLGVSPHHHKSTGTSGGGAPGATGAAHRLNGVIPRMNITPNPLAQDASADKNRNMMELRFMPPPNQIDKTTTTTSGTTTITSTTTTTTRGAAHGDVAQQSQSQTESQPEQTPPRSSSSCETLEASEGISVSNNNNTTTTTATALTATTTTTTTTMRKCANNSIASSGSSLEQLSPLSKPLPPLPTKSQKQQQQQQQSNNAVAALHLQHQHQHQQHHHHQQQQQQHHHHLLQQQQQQHHHHQSGLHHAQPYQQPPTPTACTPTMLHKRDYHQQQQQHHQQLHAVSPAATPTSASPPPPPVPPHQQQLYNNNNNNNNSSNNNNHHHHHQQQQQHQQLQQQLQQQQQHYQQQQQQHHYTSTPASPSLEQHRRTLERSVRNLQQQQQQQQQQAAYHQYAAIATDIDGQPTRIPSLRRNARRNAQQQQTGVYANNSNNSTCSANGIINGGNVGVGVGIPIVPNSPRVQRSPMPARAMIKRTRLGSHADNISSGSLNSIEV